jgi:DNA-directed RNA polymerase subunit RPC12/RpoP
MAKYVCSDCGMGVTGLTCASCGKELIHGNITKGDGTQVGVSKCPSGCGMIKSPACCGHDMALAD